MSVWSCDVCGKRFNIKNGHATTATRKGAKKTCGRECLSKLRKQTASPNMKKWLESHRPNNLKRGSGVTTDGYVWVYVPNRGYFKNQVKLHRYLMEIKLSRPLTKDEIVHHIDENKFNNNIDNLEIHTRVSHNRIHGTFAQLARKKQWSDEEVVDLYKLGRKEWSLKYGKSMESYSSMRYRRKKRR